LCLPCAKAAIIGGEVAVRLLRSGGHMPTVGGPAFERVAEPEETEVHTWGGDPPPRGWLDKSLAELFGRRGRHRRRC
jgi:hypothetical protein